MEGLNKKAKKKAAYEAKKVQHYHGAKASTQVHKSKKKYDRNREKRRR
jgi:hypothetical protein